MSAFLRSVRDWLGVEGRPPSWREPIALAVILAGAAALLVLAGRLPLKYQVILWVGLLAALLLVCRLFGPVLFYDLVRSARRLRFVAVRTLYALFIAFVLCWIFFVVSSRYEDWKIRWNDMAVFATGFFYTFMVIQFATVVLLTPAYTAGAIAEEKERKTLEFILATDLRNGEIISGKVVSRMLNLTLLLLAGVPILSLLQMLGGVDFLVVLAGFAATALTMFSLAGLSILNSVLCRRARDAIIMTYLMALAYYLLATSALIVYPLSRSPIAPGLEHFPSTDTFTSPVELGDLVDWLNAGNIGYAVFKLGRGASASAVFDEELPGVLGGYALFHALAGMACLGWSVLRLRVLALREVVKRAPKVKGVRVRVAGRPIGRYPPMIWKEVFAEGGLRLNSLGRIVAGVLVAASFLPTIIIIWVYLDRGMGRMTWHEVSRAMNAAQMRFVGTVVACLMLLAVVVRAAGSVHSERERHTFDELLTTRLTNNEILFGKWLGAMLSVRWAWAWLGLIWLISLLTGGVMVIGPPLIFVSWVVYAAVGAGVGLWFSIGSKSTLRATVASLATMIFLCGGHWLLTGMFCYMPLGVMRVDDRKWEWMLYTQAGQTPPFVMGLFAYSYEDFERSYRLNEMAKFTIASLFGVGCWAALVPVLWLLVKRRFEQVTGRTPHLRPERVTPRRRRPLGPRKTVVLDALPVDDGPGGNGEIQTVLPADEGEAGGAPQSPDAVKPPGG
jgi:ABC-type transport system involved in multi-copper enzyme maturation permease subunit